MQNAANSKTVANPAGKKKEWNHSGIFFANQQDFANEQKSPAFPGTSKNRIDIQINVSLAIGGSWNMMVSCNRGTPRSSIWMGFSSVNPTFLGTPIWHFPGEHVEHAEGIWFKPHRWSVHCISELFWFRILPNSPWISRSCGDTAQWNPILRMTCLILPAEAVENVPVREDVGKNTGKINEQTGAHGHSLEMAWVYVSMWAWCSVWGISLISQLHVRKEEKSHRPPAFNERFGWLDDLLDDVEVSPKTWAWNHPSTIQLLR